MSLFSVFIPHVFANINEKRIANIFYQLNIGKVSKVDLVKRTNDKGDKYNMAFVHFEYLFNTSSAKQFIDNVNNPEVKARLVYDNPWYWLVLPFQEKEQHQQFYPQNQQNYFMGYGSIIMTPQGPICYPMQHPLTQTVPPPIPPSTKPSIKMVPPQVAYGNLPNRKPWERKKRINVPSKKETESYQQSTTSNESDFYNKTSQPPNNNIFNIKRPTTPDYPPPEIVNNKEKVNGLVKEKEKEDGEISE